MAHKCRLTRLEKLFRFFQPGSASAGYTGVMRTIARPSSTLTTAEGEMDLCTCSSVDVDEDKAVLCFNMLDTTHPSLRFLRHT